MRYLNRGGSRWAAGAVLACLACSSAPASGQATTGEDLPAIPAVEIFSSNLSFQEALEKSKKEFKPLVIYLRPDSGGSTKMDATTWKNPTLEAWTKWHAIVKKVGVYENPVLYRALRDEMARKGFGVPGKTPVVLVFIRGELYKTIPDPRFQDMLWNNPIIGVADPEIFYPKAVQVLLQLDMVMEKLKSVDPVWSEFHTLKNPMPQAPEFDPLYATSSSIAPAAAEPAQGEAPDALGRYMEMIELIDSRLLHDATGSMTWLWERGAQWDPAFETVRTIMLPEKMNDLSKARDGAMQRITDMRGRLGARLAWMDWIELFEWMVLNEAIDESPWSLEYFIGYTIDDQEATMLPPNHNVAYLLLTSQDRWTGLPESQTRDALRWIQRQKRLLLSTDKPRTVSPRDWDDVQALRKRLLAHQACRLYAAWLTEGQDQLAVQAAHILIGAVDDGLVRQQLVATALAAGEPRPHQLIWLDEAIEMGMAHQGLRTRVQDALGPLE